MNILALTEESWKEKRSGEESGTTGGGRDAGTGSKHPTETTERKKKTNASGQPSSLFFTRLLPVNNSHLLVYHNHWQSPVLLSFIKRLLPSKSRSLLNYTVTPKLSILISHTATNCSKSRMSCLSPRLRFQNYSSQCLTNCLHPNPTTEVKCGHYLHPHFTSC